MVKTWQRSDENRGHISEFPNFKELGTCGFQLHDTTALPPAYSMDSKFGEKRPRTEGGEEYL